MSGARRALRWRVTLDNRQKLSVVPDAVFALETTTGAGEPSRAYYCLEADRGTMPVKRDNLSRSSFFRRLLAYHATWKQGIHRTRLGLPRFRVLTVTSSAERMEGMIAACAQLDGGRGLFLFAESNQLPESDPLAFSWRNTYGEDLRLT